MIETGNKKFNFTQIDTDSEVQKFYTIATMKWSWCAASDLPQSTPSNPSVFSTAMRSISFSL